MARESMEFDVVIVGGGPGGLAAACRLMQRSQRAGHEITVCVIEKGSEIGAHILSGAVFEPRALTELFPDWKERGAPLNTPVTHDDVYYLVNDTNGIKVPSWLVPGATHNHGNYAISLGNLCRWLGQQAEALGVNVFPGFAGAEVLYNDDGSVRGVATGDMGIAADGSHKPTYQPGYELIGKYTIFAEGCRGNLGKQLIKRFSLDADAATQHYAIGWPLNHLPGGFSGGFLYHLENTQAVVGLIVDLGYRNPHISPFDEFQRFKHHPKIAKHLLGGKRVSYGARAIIKGGLPALPKLTVPGGLLIGDDAGFLNMLKIKGSHTAMKSGMLAADAVFEALAAGSTGREELTSLVDKFEHSWLHEELRVARNAAPAIHKFGTLFGSAFTWFDQTFLRGNAPFTLSDPTPDYATFKKASDSPTIDYPKPDNVLSFDKLSSVFLSNTNHDEDQPCHLVLTDPTIPIARNLPDYDEPAQRYCPAGVYEVVRDGGAPRFQINGQNCVHCKTCDIKDPAQNITWVVPEGTGGPNYPNM